MDILRTVNMEVKFNGMKPTVHEFKVFYTRTYNDILIGRDLMKMFSTVKFDFTKTGAIGKRMAPWKIVGLIHAMDQSIAHVDCSTISDNDPNNLQPHLSNIQFGKGLTTEQRRTAQNLINTPTYLKKPQKTNLVEHRIFTPDALPVNKKAH